MSSSLLSSEAIVSVQPYVDLPCSVQLDVHLLMHKVWGDPLLPPSDPIVSPHNIDYSPCSCTVYVNGILASYAAVLTFPVAHHGVTFLASGLSCVATSPDFERHGFGSLAVNAATQHILHSSVDIGLFTCDPPLKEFYFRSGWQSVDNLQLISHSGIDALCSRSMGKVVFLKLVSPFALKNADLFFDDVLNLGLESGQFI